LKPQTGGSSGQCNKKKNFFKKFSGSPKVIARGVVKTGEERERVCEKIFSENPKVPATAAVKEQEDAVQGLKKYFQKTLKFPKKLTLIKKDARRNTLVAPQQSKFMTAFSALFHRGATTIRQGLSDKPLRVDFVLRGRKIQPSAYFGNVSVQSKCIPLAIHTAPVLTDTEKK
jgi:hypothetical protein